MRKHIISLYNIDDLFTSVVICFIYFNLPILNEVYVCYWFILHENHFVLFIFFRICNIDNWFHFSFSKIFENSKLSQKGKHTLILQSHHLQMIIYEPSFLFPLIIADYILSYYYYKAEKRIVY